MVLKIFAVFLLLLVAVLAVFYYLIFLKPRVRAKLDFDSEYEKERAANYPPPYPNGWFSLCSSDQVKKGKSFKWMLWDKSLQCFAERMAW